MGEADAGEWRKWPSKLFDKHCRTVGLCGMVGRMDIRQAHGRQGMDRAKARAPISPDKTPWPCLTPYEGVPT